MGVLVFLAWGCALIIYDIRFKRLPNYLTLPAALISLWWFSPVGLIWPGLYIALALATQRGSIGGGDLKLAIPLGMATAHVLSLIHI